MSSNLDCPEPRAAFGAAISFQEKQETFRQAPSGTADAAPAFRTAQGFGSFIQREFAPGFAVPLQFEPEKNPTEPDALAFHASIRTFKTKQGETIGKAARL